MSILNFWLDHSTFVTGATGLVGSWAEARSPARLNGLIAWYRNFPEVHG